MSGCECSYGIRGQLLWCPEFLMYNDILLIAKLQVSFLMALDAHQKGDLNSQHIWGYTCQIQYLKLFKWVYTQNAVSSQKQLLSFTHASILCSWENSCCFFKIAAKSPVCLSVKEATWHRGFVLPSFGNLTPYIWISVLLEDTKVTVLSFGKT